MKFQGFPLTIGWELTLKCNLSCRHCGSSAGLPRENELSTKEALSICEQFPDLLVQEVDFTGGEPLLRADWVEISNYLNELDIRTNIITHGLDITPNTIKLIEKSRVSCVGISIDGTSKTHDFIRGRKGAFNNTFKNMSKLIEEGIQVNVITTVNTLNVGQLPELTQVLSNVGVKVWRPQPLIASGRAKNNKELKIQSQVILDLGDFIKKWKPIAEKQGLNILTADGMQYIFTDNYSHYEKKWVGCPAGWSACGITSDGKVKGCLSMSDELIEGDLRVKSLWDIWFNHDAFKYTRFFSLETLGENCSSCDKGEECKGGCSVNSYTTTGIFQNDPYCYYKINSERIEA